MSRGRLTVLSKQELAGRGSDLDLGYIIAPIAEAQTETQLGFSWKSTTRTTYGILRICNRTLLGHYLRVLKSLRHLVSEPLVLGIVLLEAIYMLVPKWLSTAQADIAAVQRQTGHIGGLDLDDQSSQGPLDYDQVSLEVSRISQMIIWCRTLFKSYLYLCEFIEQSASRSKLVKGPGSSPASATNWEVFSALLNSTKCQIAHDLIYIDYLRDMCVVQNQNVYNLIAQRDVQQNIELARDSKSIAVASKRDSSAMKSIALLTMVILPGTFISTLFAIPLFNWDAESWRDVPKSRFWFYWALTIPLTILTVAMWLIWQKAFERTGRSLDKAAREQVPNSRIPHDQTSGASSSSGERDEIEQHNISDGPRMRKKGRLDGWLPWHKRSNRDTGTNQGESLV